jgi:competence protein ComFB
MEVINIVEKLVWDNIDTVIKSKEGMCGCDQCRADVAASALNNLKPKYVATEKGEVMAKAMSLGLQSHIAIITALAEAVELVHARPRHPKP